MTRYLFYVSYLGTKLCGSQAQKNFIGAQNVLNNALALVLNVPTQVIRTNSASRTDAGVHALRTTYATTLWEKNYRNNMAFDMKFQKQSLPYDPDHLCAAINHVLKDMDFDMRILGCRVVARGFCPRRHAQFRSYLYRLLVLKPEFDNNPERPSLLRDPTAFAPLLEKDRSWAIPSEFDSEKFYQAAKSFEGSHDFKCFTSSQPDTPDASTLRTINSVEVLQGTPLMDPRYEPLSGCFRYIDILVHSKSFLYRQIRKMVASMVAVSQNRISLQDLKWLLDNPRENHWNKFALEMAPAGGLYLLNITYDPQDFENPSRTYRTDATNETAIVQQGEDLEDEEAEEAEDSSNSSDVTSDESAAMEKVKNSQNL